MDKKLDELKALNEKFYDLYGRLFKNRNLLDSDKTFRYIGERLFEQYKAEYEALKYKYELEELPTLEKVKQLHKELVPHSWRPWYFLFFVRRRNRAFKNIEREAFVEIEQLFRAKEAALDRLEAALDKTDTVEQRTTAFDEVQTPDTTKPAGTVPKTNAPKPAGTKSTSDNAATQ